MIRLALGDADGATQWSQEALARDPDDPQAHAAQGMSLVAGGDPSGWRWLLHKGLQRPVPAASRFSPGWYGAPLAGGVIAVYSHGDGGLGDIICNARFLRYLRDRGARRVVAVLDSCHAPLAPLLSVQDYIDGVAVGQEPPIPADVHARFSNLAPLLSVGGNVPISEKAYLAIPPHPLARQVRDLPGLRIGVVWGGSTPPDHHERYAQMATRNIAFSALSPLWNIPGISWISLQKGPHAAALATAPPPDIPILNIGDRLDDLAVTAAVIATCDLVITVDTAVANLAGAMGSPVWVLLHDKYDLRWFGPTPSTSYKYPGATLFRQVPGTGWGPVTAAISAALRRVLATPPGLERQHELRHPSGAGLVYPR